MRLAGADEDQAAQLFGDPDGAAGKGSAPPATSSVLSSSIASRSHSVPGFYFGVAAGTS